MVESPQCLICGQSRRHLMPASMVRSSIGKLIQANHPDWNDRSYICLDDLNLYRSRFVEEVLAEERGELTNLEADVIRSLKEQEIIAENTNKEIAASMSFGDRLSDAMASFGGSWSFLILFAAGMSLWILYNSLQEPGRQIDPFPFILLNLVLSCLAAVQAPVIMMSQNRQESKDRLRAENDYRVNLKAELEIRHLHSKLDVLLTHQWQRLLEIQQIQTELIQQIAQREDPADPRTHSQGLNASSGKLKLDREPVGDQPF